MCGIAGGVALSEGARPSAQRVRNMSSLTSHRGPDGCGLWESPSGLAVLAHRRLAIIDLATGAQPMVADNNVALTFNGEIYNYLELRSSLQALGHRFATQSDSEVLLKSYGAFGSECVGSFRGMFAFAIWHEEERRLLLARDRLGKKPLYFTVDNGCLYFASSLGALSRTSPVPATLSAESLSAFLTLGYIPAPATAFRGYYKLRAGSTLSMLTGGGLSEAEYWSPSANHASFAGDYPEAVARCHELLREATSIRLRSDVPLGVFLSGGIDSSLVASLASRSSTERVDTFSVRFDVSSFDESAHAARIATHLGTRHTTIDASSDVFAELPALVRQAGEPFADSAILPLAALARRTREHVTVALSGDGGDEVFAGYRWYAGAQRASRVAAALSAGRLSYSTRTIAHILARRSGGRGTIGRAARLLALLGEQDDARRYAMRRTLFSPETTMALLGSTADEIESSLDYSTTPFRLAGGDDVHRMRVTDVATVLPESLMPKVDLATMAAALEARSPLLDHTLVDFGLSLPAPFLVDGDGGKRILKSVLAEYIPPALFVRPKQGFTVPLDEWFSGGANRRLSALVRSEALASIPQLNMDVVAALAAEHELGQRRHGERLFALLVLDEWIRQQ
jgi:asparagine synthase (glutamine-hydrolysing)